MEMHAFMEGVGFLAASFSMSSFAPQVWKVHKTKDTAAISLLFIAAASMSGILWFSYGLYFKNNALIVSNFVNIIFTGIILLYKIRNMFLKGEKS